MIKIKPEARKGRFVPSEILNINWPMGVLIQGEPIAGTAKAILLRIDGVDKWIAKSLIEGFSMEDGIIKAIVPEWVLCK